MQTTNTNPGSVTEPRSLLQTVLGDGDTCYPPTRISLLVEVKGSDDKKQFAALSELCRIYWYPVYSTARKCGCPAQDAADLTQELFRRLVKNDGFASIQKERGRLRAYLRTSVKRLCQENYRRETAGKRIPGRVLYPIDAEEGDARYLREELSGGEAPDIHFDRMWIQALLREVENRLAEEFNYGPMKARFEALRPYIMDGSAKIGYAELAAELGVKEGALKTSLSRLRTRFREAFRAEVAHIVSDEDAVEDEIRSLLSAFA
jgi:RNA polymerase sigma-70 factor (ECF subfamily)